MIQPEHVMVCEWILLSLAFVLVGLRIAVRRRMKQRHLYLSDGLLVLACVFALGLVICDTLAYRGGYMNIEASENAFIGKVHFATNYFFDAGLYLPKLSMVAIYYYIIPLYLVWLRRALGFVAAFTSAAFFVTVLADTFWCGRDVATNWDDGPDACSAFNSVQLMRINWSLCISCESMPPPPFSVFLLPLPLIVGLRHRSKRELAGLTVLLTLGVVTLFVSSGRFVTMMKLGNDISLYIWATTEMCVSIMVVACTALRPLLRTAWRATRQPRSKSPCPPNKTPGRPHGTPTARGHSSLGTLFAGTEDGEGRATDDERAGLVEITPLPPVRTRSRGLRTFWSIGASDLDRDVELGNTKDRRGIYP